ncbi:Glycosyl transferase family 2 [Pseudomonas guineae]|uniref:Glycosyl transferase family 2 n=1 Tax=Pseudomonas guineae TaxID=425504 RepID=A0A1I3CVB9_9PSED|nr:glycosyltransferase family 2 protein [Pseudomonas guineae]SFH78181.1 Glycosyl transferase family 2 [Pseudomonas guineae]
MVKPLVSVVTVVFNGVDCIEGTIKSVLEQNCPAGWIEYLVVDGGSSDGTLGVLDKYPGLRYISASDKGIYDAMNKGIALSSGKWIVFMNAGDIFYSNSTVRDLFSGNDFEGVDVVYGDCVVDYAGVLKYRKAGQVEDLWKGSRFSHQSAFIESSRHKKNTYNITNRIAGDFEFFYNLYISGGTFHKVDNALSIVTAGGLSDVKRIDSIVSQWNVVKKSNFVNLIFIKIICWELVKSVIKKVVRRKKAV